MDWANTCFASCKYALHNPRVCSVPAENFSVNCANVSQQRRALEAEVNTTKITARTSTHYTEDTRNLCVKMNLIKDVMRAADGKDPSSRESSAASGRAKKHWR